VVIGELALESGDLGTEDVEAAVQHLGGLGDEPVAQRRERCGGIEQGYRHCRRTD
jgi:hypothetical protein